MPHNIATLSTYGLGAVAAGSGRGAVPGSDVRNRCGDRKKGEGKRGEGSELGEHLRGLQELEAREARAVC